MRSVIVLVLSVLLCSCAAFYSSVVGGARIVDSDYVIEKRLVTYAPDDKKKMSGTYHLIMEKGQLALYEEEPGQMGTVMKLNRQDAEGDHFVIWVANAQAGEVIVPANRQLPARYFLFQPGTYTIEDINGIKRPVPKTPQEPVTQLLPVKIY